MSEPCPWESRREQSGLFWSFAMTTIACVCAYAHLLHSHLGYKKSSFIIAHVLLLLTFPLLPLSFLLYCTVITVLSLIRDECVEIGYSQDTNVDPGSRTILDLRWNWRLILLSLAGISDMRADGIRGPYTSLSRRFGGLKTRWPVIVLARKSPRRWDASRLGRATLQALALLQATGTLIKALQRSTKPDSMILLDWAMLYTSLGGLATLLLSIPMELSGLARALDPDDETRLLLYSAAVVGGTSVALALVPYAGLPGAELYAGPTPLWTSMFPTLYSLITIDSWLTHREPFPASFFATILLVWPFCFSLWGSILSRRIKRALFNSKQDRPALSQIRVSGTPVAYVLWTPVVLLVHAAVLCPLLYYVLMLREGTAVFAAADGRPWPTQSPCPKLRKDDLWTPSF